MSDGERVVAAMVGVARRWMEQAGGDDLVEVLPKHLAHMREEGLDLDLEAALKAVDEYDERQKRLCWGCHGRIPSCGGCYGHSRRCTCPNREGRHIEGCPYWKAGVDDVKGPVQIDGYAG